MGSEELVNVRETFESNWIAPLGPQVDAFEAEFAAEVGSSHAVALSSGTAALHLALKLVGVRQGDLVLCSTLTFCASANPIVYERAVPVFIDSEEKSWNLDPSLLEDALKELSARGKKPAALILVHLYGQCADLAPIAKLCADYGVPLIEDAAEALGATYWGRDSTHQTAIAPGTLGAVGVYSFNGNKIITTSGGGMLVTPNRSFAEKARFWATQARDSAPHYQHSEIGYNYRMSNVLAGIGRGQLRVLADRVESRRKNFMFYQQSLSALPGISFMPEASWGKATRWLTCITVDPHRFGADREKIRNALAAENIESRQVWKPMHLQPVYSGSQSYGGAVAASLFERGLCLPSGSNLSEDDLRRVVAVVHAARG